jgi:serine/threonine protein kinase
MGKSVQPQIIGRYTLYGEIAAGRTGNVHFGRRRGSAGFSRVVVVKRMRPNLARDPEFVSTMIAEARLVARVRHPNVVPTFVAVADGELLSVTEYVRGESLGRLLKIEAAGGLRGLRVPLPIVSAVAVGALEGLHAAHMAVGDHGAPLGIVHRDVSPQNILVGADGGVRVIDFGIAKAAGHLQATPEGAVEGKMAYRAPEQLAARDVTAAADVYAMAAVLWEALAGARLFAGDDDDVCCQVLEGAKEPPSRHVPSLPAELDVLVMKGLEPRPADRFASARQMAEALARVVQPALPAEVGAWVEQVARWKLSQRDAAFAEAERSSGVAMATLYPTESEPSLLAAKILWGEEAVTQAVPPRNAPEFPPEDQADTLFPPPYVPQDVPQDARDVPPSVSQEDDGHTNVDDGELLAVPERGRDGDDDAATVASQPPNPSMETPRRKPGVVRLHNVRRLAVLRAARTQEARERAERSRRVRLLAALVAVAGLIAAASFVALLWRGGASSSGPASIATTPPPATSPSAVTSSAPPVIEVASPPTLMALPTFTVSAPPAPATPPAAPPRPASTSSVASVAPLAPPVRPAKTSAAPPPLPTSPPTKTARDALQSSGF